MSDAPKQKNDLKPAQVEVTVEGEWLPAPKRDWRGLIKAPELVVGISFLSIGGHTEWAKSDRGSVEGLEARVMLGKFGSHGLDVQVNFSIGKNGPRWRTLVNSAIYFPEILAPRTFFTGELIEFAKVDGKPSIELKAILLARRDVKVGRNGLWHLKKEFTEFFDEPLRGILTYGRSGELNFAI